MRRLRMRMAWVIVLLTLLGAAGTAQAQALNLHLESEEVFANLPFVLIVEADGFDESPQPTLSKLVIPGCRVTPLGVEPQVASMVSIINGQRSESRQVKFLYRFRVEATQAGQIAVPALSAEQGSKRAQSRPGRISVRSVEETRDMQVRVVLPERPLWVGETVDGALEWYLRREVGSRAFSMPLFDLDEFLEVEVPPGEPKLQGFRAGSRPIELPYEQSKATLDGVEYTRFRFLFRVTASKPTTMTVAPARVVAELQVGYGRDLFGFQVPRSQLFSALAKPLKLDIRPLPLSGRPAYFKNAVGGGFSLDVQAGRTVVRVGDPIELRILLRGHGRLSGLILPDPMAMGLSPTQFAAPEEPPSGEVLQDGKGKLFRVTVRLRGTDVKEIPALSFGYFDPEKGGYQTVQSQPIALSVKGSAVVAAADVVGAKPATPTAPTATGGGGGRAVEESLAQVLVGADLSLSEERATLSRAVALRTLWPLLAGLYAAALGLLAVHAVRVRKGATWQRDARRQELLGRLQREVAAARTGAARDAAPRICAALRGLRRDLGLPGDAGRALIDRLETEAYSPHAAREPLPGALCDEVLQLAGGWMRTKDGARAGGGGDAARVMTWVALLATGMGVPLASRLHAQAGAAEARLSAARTAYRAALSESDRDRRRAGFAEAESALRELATAMPDRPQLLTDWGNAALLAQEPGRAMLAYRRALSLDPTLARARRNLSFLRDRMPDWLPRPGGKSGSRGQSALDVLPLSGQTMARPLRHVGLAGCVLLAVALLIPWAGRRKHRWLSALPVAGAGLFALSLWADRDPGREAVVVVPGAILRSADSAGAPPAFAHALPAGAEVTLGELRGDYARVALADGQTGWLSASMVEVLAPDAAAVR